MFNVKNTKTTSMTSKSEHDFENKAYNFIKKRLQYRCFSVKFLKILRRPILKTIYERLLDNHQVSPKCNIKRQLTLSTKVIKVDLPSF